MEVSDQQIVHSQKLNTSGPASVLVQNVILANHIPMTELVSSLNQAVTGQSWWYMCSSLWLTFQWEKCNESLSSKFFFLLSFISSYTAKNLQPRPHYVTNINLPNACTNNSLHYDRIESSIACMSYYCRLKFWWIPRLLMFIVQLEFMVINSE